MHFSPYDPTEPCPVCNSKANLRQKEFRIGTVVDCSRCGDFSVDFETVQQINDLPRDLKRRALASYVIQKMQAPYRRPHLTMEFFKSLADRVLPSPAEAMDNLLISLAEQQDGRPGTQILLRFADPSLLGRIGVVEANDIGWIVDSLRVQALLDGTGGADSFTGRLSARGWERIEEIKRAHTSSNYAFFARQFSNPDLDQVFEKCLLQAVQQTGYVLRTVTQRAGLVDAQIEDEIRRCRFLIADLSDDNAGAYWEAGLAEGLGKPVIYICRGKHPDGTTKRTHFDADHRHTVRWNLETLDETAVRLKAVIRNTLLGDAKQTD